MANKTNAVLALMLGLCLAAPLLAQTPADIQGTWVGPAALQGMEGVNELTLVLEVKDGALSGRITDQYRSMTESPLSDIKLEDGGFHFSAPAMGPNGQEVVLVFTMKVEGSAMTGTLEIPDLGLSGTWEAKKQDQKRPLRIDRLHPLFGAVS